MIAEIKAILHICAVLLFSPLLLGIIAKTKAFFAGRKGQPILQTYYDIVKLFCKGNVYSTTTTWIFQAAPIVFFASMLAVSLVIPLGSMHAPFEFWGDFLAFAYILGIAKFFMILAALDTGSSFEGMGASREAIFSCFSEIVLFLDFIVLGLLSGHFMISEMITSGIVSSWKFSGSELLLVTVSFFLVLLAENARIPIDDPDTHLELTMVHEVMVLDHSGLDLGYIIYASAVKLFIFCALLVMMVMPCGQDPWIKNVFFVCGMIVLAVLIGIVESSMARLRLNRVPQVLTSAFVVALIALLVVLTKMTL